MSVDEFRLVESQWEWQSLSNLADSPYHDPAWTYQSVARIRLQARASVSCGYVRVWHSDTMIGCPVIRVNDRWFNSPRASPTVLSGPPVDEPSRHIMQSAAKVRDPGRELVGINGIVISHDTSQLAEIARAAQALDERAVSHRDHLSLTKTEITLLAKTIPWQTDDEWQHWVDVITRLWRAGSWKMTMRSHFDGDQQPIGFTIWIERPNGSTACLSALTCHAPVPAWASPR